MEDLFDIEIYNETIEKDIFNKFHINDQFIEEIFDINRLHITLSLYNLDKKYNIGINYLKKQYKHYLDIDEIHFNNKYRYTINNSYFNKIDEINEKYNSLKKNILKEIIKNDY